MMLDLEYRVGGLDMDVAPGRFKLREKEDERRLDYIKRGNRYPAVHIFIVERNQNICLIHISGQVRAHGNVAYKFSIPDERIVGGGSCYMDSKGILILDNFSGTYGAIPNKAAQKFAELIKPKLKEIGLPEAVGIAVNMDESKLISFWN